MRTDWDYTELASAYINRPDYADAAIDAMLSVARIGRGDKCCDVGAGAAHLTLILASRGIEIVAVEPNDAMRTNGIKRTKGLANVKWEVGVGEATGQISETFDLVTFGSSFNVCNRKLALEETARILVPRGWFACMWNHRELGDSIQSQIERIIKNIVPDYGYGSRRDDQENVINECGLFGSVVHIDSRVTHNQSIVDCIGAWRSHATLQRQAGSKFKNVLSDIEQFLYELGEPTIKVPYKTNIWLAQLK